MKQTLLIRIREVDNTGNYSISSREEIKDIWEKCNNDLKWKGR